MPRRQPRPALALALIVSLLLVLAACASSGGDRSTPTSPRPPAGSTASATERGGSILVSAAASLNGAFTEIGKDFEAANPGTEVTFTFDSSSALATAITSGAPSDVFASADTANMDVLVAAHDVDGTPTTFARNRLAIVTKPGNPTGITTLADLASAGVISLCGADVPCGRFAAQALHEAGVTIPESSVTRGQNATATLTAVTTGDAVAGIVYVTDARSAGDAVDTVSIPDADNAVATYPAAVLTGSKHAALARAFVAYVASAKGQAVLKADGFLPPA